MNPNKPGKFTYGKYSFKFEPFYIGKGTGHRWKRHLDFNNKSASKNYNIGKKEIILSILSNNIEPVIIKYKENLTTKKACDLEKKMIESVGRYDKVLGPLTNKSDSDVLGKYESIKEAGQKLKIDQKSISQCCHGDIKILKNRWIFLFKDQTLKKRIRGKKEYPVIRTDIYGNIKEYKSLTEADREGLGNIFEITEACSDKKLIHKGYYWDYKNKIIDKTKIIEDYKIELHKVTKKDLDGNIVKIYKDIVETYIEEKIKLYSLCKNIQGIYKNIKGFTYEYQV